MKKILYPILVALFLFSNLQVISQDVTAKLSDAENAYQSGDLEGARFALQQALGELDQVLGKEILSMLPTEIDGVPTIPEEDNVTGNALGFTGMYVNRTYQSETHSANVELIDDSPLIASINTLLQMPSFMAASDPNQKRIKIHGYKALMNKSVDDSTGVVSFEVQIPFNKSLLTFKSKGFNDENTVISIAESLPLEAIVRMTR